MLEVELVTEYVATCQELLDAEDKVNQLIHQAGDASVLKDWKHWNPDEIPSVLEVLRFDRWTNGQAIAAALTDWSDKRYAAHKKYGEVIDDAEPAEFLKIPKPDRLDRVSVNDWQAYFSAATKL